MSTTTTRGVVRTALRDPVPVAQRVAPFAFVVAATATTSTCRRVARLETPPPFAGALPTTRGFGAGLSGSALRGYVGKGISV